MRSRTENSQKKCVRCGEEAPFDAVIFSDKKRDALCGPCLLPIILHRYNKMKEAVERIFDWRNAYPVEMFPRPNLEADRKLLGDSDFALLNAAAMRHVVTRIAAISEAAFAPEEREAVDGVQP